MIKSFAFFVVVMGLIVTLMILGFDFALQGAAGLPLMKQEMTQQ